MTSQISNPDGAIVEKSLTSRPRRSVSGRGAHTRSIDRNAGSLAEEKFFTVEEVADFLNVCTRTVRRWIERGELVAHRFGTAVRIAESDLRAFIARQRAI
jgi:excisionase family DNA binding protein